MTDKKQKVVEATAEANFKAQNMARIEVLKRGIELHEKFRELRALPLFKELIEDLYIRDEAANLVALIADPQSNNADQQRSVQMRLGGVSALQSFMSQYDRAGLTAKAEVSQLEDINRKLDAGKDVNTVLLELEQAAG